MADKSIFDLTLQSTFGVNDRLVVGNYANNDAEAILGQTLISLLTTALDGHGGIQSIAKTSSSGTNPVVDTYTITYADASTSTFTITNGLKGDTGAQTYVYLRWAHECTGTPPVPASWASTTSDPDDWIGIGTGTSSSAPTNVNSYKWYQYKGDKGDTGTAATITTQAVEYQVSASGTTAPTGTWSSTVPSVSQGQYLWTRTTLNFNDGTTVTSYSVGRMGVDGSGAVSTINNIGVDVGTTNVTLTGTDIPINSSNTANSVVVSDGSGKLSASGISATELGYLSGASSNIQSQITGLGTTVAGKATKATYTATLASANWSGSDPYTITVTVSGLLATDTPVMDLVASATYATAQNEIADYGSIYKAVCSANTLTVYATSAPTHDLSIQLVCVR